MFNFNFTSTMKKYLFALLAVAALFTGCEKSKEQPLPEVSFETASPLLSDDGVATFRIVSDYKGQDAVTIPVKFSSTNGAVAGTDYTVSAEAFVLGGAQPLTQISVTPLVYGSKKDVSAEIVIPEGFKAGKFTKSSFVISEKLGYVSFSMSKSIMTDNIEVGISVFNDKGHEQKVSVDTEFEVKVNTEKSTAVEGTHFKFTNGKSVKVEKGKSSAAVKIEFIGEDADAEHNLLVLELVESQKYAFGDKISTKVEISGPTWKVFGGKWVIKEIVDKEEDFYLNGETAETMAGYPKLNKEDSFTIDFNSGTFTPDFKSSLKNYFIGESKFTTCGQPWRKENTDYNIKLGMTRSFMAYVIELDNVNRYFSETETSESKLAFLGLALDSEDSNLLHVLVVDHEARTFLKNAITNWYGGDYNMMYHGGERPTANMSSVGFEVTFTKAK